MKISKYKIIICEYLYCFSLTPRRPLLATVLKYRKGDEDSLIDKISKLSMHSIIKKSNRVSSHIKHLTGISPQVTPAASASLAVILAARVNLAAWKLEEGGGNQASLNKVLYMHWYLLFVLIFFVCHFISYFYFVVSGLIVVLFMVLKMS